jgi:hypothetical protein
MSPPRDGPSRLLVPGPVVRATLVPPAHDVRPHSSLDPSRCTVTCSSLDDERAAFGTGYDTSHSKLMRYEDGRRLHADTVTRRFNRLVDLAGVRRIRLHDVRHTYATLSLDSGVHAKIVSDRIGHAHEGITVQLYGHRSTGHDREAAELVAGLIRTRLDAPTTDAG